jgi:hypothetical protein
MLNEQESRERARELLLAINAAVDQAMARAGLKVSKDVVAAVLQRAQFLERFSGIRVHDHHLRAAYVHLHETLGDMSAEPLPLDANYQERVEEFIDVLGSV